MKSDTLQGDAVSVVESGRVDYSGQGLEVFPPELRNNHLVTHLNIRSNSIQEIPDWINTLVNLEWIDLAGNPVTELPESIGELSRLSHLDLYGCQLSTLPSEVGDLPRLQLLGLSRNRIARLPERVRFPQSLRILYLGHNQFEEVPDQVRPLASLSLLFLSGNRVCALPSWIGELVQLRELRLGENRLMGIPGEVGRLRHLEELALGGNTIWELPTELGDLSSLRALELDPEVLSPPQSLAYSSGPRGLLAYLRGLSKGSAIRHEAKVLVVGEGDTGKTTLLHRLKHGSFESLLSTHGIEVDHLRLERTGGGEPVFVLNTWDFGGQEVYRITHQFFFSKAALYLLVWKPRRGVQESAVEDWLRRIRLRVGSGARVLIVATHGDERQAEIDVPWLRREFGDMIAGSLVVDSLSGSGIAGLRLAIYNNAETLPFSSMPWPVSWVAVREHLASEACQSTQITWYDFVRLCEGHGLEEDECLTLAEILAELGHIVYWSDDPTLRDIIILQPEWLTKAISYVLEDGETRASGGVLDYDRAVEIWNSYGSVDRFERDHYPFFLRLMERFDVSYRVEGRPQALVGQLVPYERPAIAGELPPSASAYVSIRAMCTLSEDPPGLMPWLIVRSNRDWHQPPVHWRRGVFLFRKRYDSYALLEQVAPTRLCFRISAPSPDFYFHVILDIFEEVISRWPGLRWEILMPCPTSGMDMRPCEGAFALQALFRARELGRRVMTCHECLSDVDVAGMLTGFRSRLARGENSPTSAEISDVISHLDLLHRQVSEVAAVSTQSLALTTSIADGVRGLFRFISTEVIDSPRLISVEQQDHRLFDPRRFFETKYRLHLWCEHEDDRHRVGQYEFSRPREWWIEAAPYIRAASVVLGGVPVARSLLQISMSGMTDTDRRADLTRLSAELDLMKELGDVALIAPEHVDAHRAQTQSELMRAGSRRIRAALFELDPGRHFFGLNRTPLTPTGEFFWVCEKHMPSYDPGLPTVPQ